MENVTGESLYELKMYINGEKVDNFIFCLPHFRSALREIIFIECGLQINKVVKQVVNNVVL